MNDPRRPARRPGDDPRAGRLPLAPAHRRPVGQSTTTTPGWPAILESLAAAGVPEEARERVWTALNEASHSHPDARLARHYVHDGDRRDLPRHDTVDRALRGVGGQLPPAPPAAPSPAGAELARRQALEAPDRDAAYSR